MAESLGLLALFALAFVVEGALGFGSSVVVATVGALLFDVSRVMPVFITANLALSAWVAWGGRRFVDGGLLGRVILPPMAAGMALGMSLPRGANHPLARVAFGALVAVLAANELRRALSRAASEVPLPRALSAGLLGLGGVVHGVFAAGGPLVVLVAARRAPDPRVFRATLSALWLVMNLVLVGGWAWQGTWTRHTFVRAVFFAPAVFLGGTLGGWLHRALPARGFRVAAASVLGVAGLSLTARTLAAL